MARSRPLLVLICCLGMVGSGSVTSGAATTGAPVANGKIVFETQRDGNFEIYSMNPDGSDQTNLSNNDDDEFNPVWSPDGSKVAFMTDAFGSLEIFVMNADGTGQTRLTNNTAGDYDPVWSPDGTKILFESERDFATPGPDEETFELYVMNADGTSQTRLTNNNVAEFDPLWSPDGTKILFESYRDGNPEIYVMDADGTGQTNLTSHAADDYDAMWSPDGTKIAFESERDGNTELYLMNADGTAQTRLTNNPAEDYFADCCYQRESWSPDGTKLAFLSERDGNFEIYVMNADGTGQTRLTNNTSGDWDPSWSPDGTKILFESERDFGTENDDGGPSFELYVMNADGSAPTRLTNNAFGDYEPEWQVLTEPPPTPDTTIIQGPKAKTTDRTPKFTFESSVPGSTFECSKDAKPFAACSSPKTYGRQKLGHHTFRVRAIAGGVTDPTPATMTWKIKRKQR